MTKIERARQRVQEARATVTGWEAKAGEIARELRDAEEGAGVAVLAAGDVAGVSDRIGELRGHLSATRAAVDAAKSALVEAERRALVAEAGELRGEADELDKRAERAKRKRAELLQALEEAEEYPGPPGRGFVERQPEADVASDAPAWAPLSRRLRNEAVSVRRRADELERKAGALASAGKMR